MSSITLYTRNILETGTVTVTGDPDTGYPEARLYDRCINLYWKDTVEEAKVFHVDQSASPLAVDLLYIPKHNFNGEDLQWQWSANDADWNDAVTDWNQGDNEPIVKTLETALTKDYWRVDLSSMVNPMCSEIFMSYGYTFTVMDKPAPVLGELENVQWNRTVGGTERSTKFGDARRTRTYGLFPSASELTDFRSAMADLDEYSRPFLFKDHEGSYFMCRLQVIPQETHDHKTDTHITISVIEEL